MIHNPSQSALKEIGKGESELNHHPYCTNMKHTIIYLIFLFFSLSARAQPQIDSLLYVLDQTIHDSDVYTRAKDERIGLIRERLSSHENDDADRYRIHSQLSEEYKAYVSDSARHYIHLNLALAEGSGNEVWHNETKIKQASLFATTGLYPEALDLLTSIDKQYLTPQGLIEYYLACEHTYLYMTEYVSGDAVMSKYLGKMYLYRDSALMVLPQNSYQYAITKAPRLIDEGKVKEAEELLTSYLPQVLPGTRNYSVTTSILAYVYDCAGKQDLRKEYLIKSAISDIRAAVKENNSLRALAEMLYVEGQISRADQYVKISLEDANFYNARLRNIQASKMLPIIDSAYRQEKEQQNKKLQVMLLIISLLSLFLLIAVIYVIRQIRKLAAARGEVIQVNKALHKLNAELRATNAQQQQTNKSLTEANYVKEEYIARFLSLCSTYIDKMEAYRRMLNKHAAAGKMEELFKAIKSTKLIEDELKEFYRNFDSSFLKIYPDFVSHFNRLLPQEEWIVPKQDECLTAELRIFALIRLGINDSSKIADFLRYSITTIYTYRSKMKNRSLHKDNFEEKVMEIGAF